MYSTKVLKTTNDPNEIAIAIKKHFDSFKNKHVKIMALSQVCDKEGQIITTIII